MEPSLLVNDGYIIQRERIPILTHIVFRRTDFVAFECEVSESNLDCPVPLCIDKLFSYPLKSGDGGHGRATRGIKYGWSVNFGDDGSQGVEKN